MQCFAFPPPINAGLFILNAYEYLSTEIDASCKWSSTAGYRYIEQMPKACLSHSVEHLQSRFSARLVQQANLFPVQGKVESRCGRMREAQFLSKKRMKGEGRKCYFGEICRPLHSGYSKPDNRIIHQPSHTSVKTAC